MRALRGRTTPRRTSSANAIKKMSQPMETISLSSGESSEASEPVSPRKKVLTKGKGKAKVKAESSASSSEEDKPSINGDMSSSEEDVKMVKKIAKKLGGGTVEARGGKKGKVDVSKLARETKASLKGKGKAVDKKPSGATKKKKSKKVDTSMAGLLGHDSDSENDSEFAPPDSDVSMSDASTFDSDVDQSDRADDLTLGSLTSEAASGSEVSGSESEAEESDEDEDEDEDDMPNAAPRKTKKSKKGKGKEVVVEVGVKKPKKKTRPGYKFSSKEKAAMRKMSRVSFAAVSHFGRRH